VAGEACARPGASTLGVGRRDRSSGPVVPAGHVVSADIRRTRPGERSSWSNLSVRSRYLLAKNGEANEPCAACYREVGIRFRYRDVLSGLNPVVRESGAAGEHGRRGRIIHAHMVVERCSWPSPGKSTRVSGRETRREAPGQFIQSADAVSLVVRYGSRTLGVRGSLGRVRGFRANLALNDGHTGTARIDLSSRGRSVCPTYFGF
jgi:hypothetical protein